MTKYLIFGENDKKPIRKTKHENDAFLFISDFKNLQQYGCMTIIREDDDGMQQVWNADMKAWEGTGGSNG